MSDCPHGFAFAFGCRDEVCNTDRGELQLARLRAVADAARAFIREDGESTEVSAASVGRSLAAYAERRAVLSAALEALDGDDRG